MEVVTADVVMYPYKCRVATEPPTDFDRSGEHELGLLIVVEVERLEDGVQFRRTLVERLHEIVGHVGCRCGLPTTCS